MGGDDLVVIGPEKNPRHWSTEREVSGATVRQQKGFEEKQKVTST